MAKPNEQPAPVRYVPTLRERAARVLTAGLVAGWPCAIALSDAFAEAGVHLPMLNWPPALELLDVTTTEGRWT